MLTASDQERLFAAAIAARRRAYAPFSQFAVGAAILTRNGRLFEGANYESASYGLSLCAERAGLVAVQREGMIEEIVAIAVTAARLVEPQGGAESMLADPVTPCGACRQWIFEAAHRVSATHDFPLYCGNSTFSEWTEASARSLLPHGFAF